MASNLLKDDDQKVEMDVDDELVGNCPEFHWTMYVCFPLRCFFVWLIPYIIKFMCKPATLQSLPKLDKDNRVENLEDKFDFWWDVFSYKKPRNEDFKCYHVSCKIWRWICLPIRLCGGCCCLVGTKYNGVKLWLTVMMVLGLEYWTSFLVMLISQTELIFVPKAMEKFLLLLAPKLNDDTEAYLEFTDSILPSEYSPDMDDLPFRKNDYEIWLWLLLLVFLQTTSYLFQEWGYHRCINMGLKARSALQSRIYSKSLVLSSKSRLKYDNGVILNYSSVDLIKVEQVFMWFHWGVCSFVQIIGGLYYLIRLIDWGALSGYCAVILFIPMICPGMIAWMGSMSVMKKILDKRIGAIEEVLKGIRIIKFFTWEDSYKKKIINIRKKEGFVLRILFVTFAMLFSTFSSLTTFISIFAYMTYYFVHGHLSPITVFTSMTYFQLLKWPLITAPMMTTMYMDMFVSLQRIQGLLDADELDSRYEVYESNDGKDLGIKGFTTKKKVDDEYSDSDDEFDDLPAIEISNGGFFWDADPKDLVKGLKKQKKDEIKKKKEEIAKMKEDWKIGKKISKEEKMKMKDKKKQEMKELKAHWKKEVKQFKKEAKLAIKELKLSAKKKKKERLRKKDIELEDNFKVEEVILEEEDDEEEEEEEGKLKKHSLKDMQGKLNYINFVAPKGKLTMICGGVGSGKSSLISAVLGEMKVNDRVFPNTKMRIRGKIAYTVQVPWIQNASLKDNILFGKEYEKKWFDEIIDTCCLRKDLGTLTGGVNIEIGEKGINLSGGQKYRVSLARACYQKDRDIFLFDDPLSAVDSHVGAKLVDGMLLDLLKDKTRVIVTHQIQYLEKADWVVCMKKGTICEMGKYEDLMKDEDGEVHRMVKQFFEEKEEEKEEEEEEQEQEEEEKLKKKKQEELEEEEEEEGDEKLKKKKQEELEEEEIMIELKETDMINKEKKVQKKKKNKMKVFDDSDDSDYFSGVSSDSDDDSRSDKKSDGDGSQSSSSSENKKNIEDEDGTLIQKEEKKTGLVHPRVFLGYCKAMGCLGILPVFLILSTQFLGQIFVTGSDWWLAEWSRKTFVEEYSQYYTSHIVVRNINTTIEGYYDYEPDYITNFEDESEMEDLWNYLSINVDYEYYDSDDYDPATTGKTIGCPFYVSEEEGIENTNRCFEIYDIELFWILDYENDEDKTEEGITNVHAVIIYGCIGLLGLFFAFFRDCVFLNYGVTASNSFHHKALKSLLNAPMSFFDTTPIGRIVNRFSNDLQSMDSKLLYALTIILSSLTALFFTFVLIGYLTRGIGLIFVLPCAIFYIVVYLIYRQTHLELKRLTTVTRSPILSLVGESLEGLSTIRAYGVEEQFQKRLRRYINLNNRAFYLMWASERWLATNLALMGAFLVFGICSLSICFWYYWDFDINLAHLALAISYSIIISMMYYMVSEQITIAEVEFNSVERLHQYATKLPKEKPRRINEVDSKLEGEKWPKSGQIKFSNFSMRYRDGLPLVLKDLEFEVNSGERIGVCGRTGSGKSTLMICLFRLVEAEKGEIFIDGKDISQIGTKLLRKSVSIIPQDPVLFSGTVRSNLDPFEHYTDKMCWDALEKSKLKKTVKERTKQLNAVVKEGGENFSVGERQLLCLARAMLKSSRILVLDECTASIDLELDEFIQKKIREEFKQCTILTIAHRINTIIDYDRILVLEDGRIAEFDTPRNLLMKSLDDEKAIFRHLVRETGEKNERFLMDVAMGRRVITFSGVTKVDVQEEEEGEGEGTEEEVEPSESDSEEEEVEPSESESSMSSSESDGEINSLLKKLE